MDKEDGPADSLAEIAIGPADRLAGITNGPADSLAERRIMKGGKRKEAIGEKFSLRHAGLGLHAMQREDGLA